MYHPRARTDEKNLEFVEIYNAGLIVEDLAGHKLSGEVDFVFPGGTSVPPGGFVVVAPNPTDVREAYGLAAVLGGFTNRLSNAGGTLRLHNPAGAVLLEVTYADVAPWPISADGAGHSLVLDRPSYGEGDARAWAASARVGGSPGVTEPNRNPAWQGITINELMANTDKPLLDFVEIHNKSQLAVDLSGCRLTDDPARPGFMLPSDTVLSPGGFLEFDGTQLGFALSSEGEALFLFNPDASIGIDAVRFGAQASGVSWGRSPDGEPIWNELRSPTPGTSNAPPLLRPVVINEIMYHPISGEEDEYVELFNQGPQSIAIGGWRLTDGVEFAFPPDAMIPAGGFVTISKDVERLRARHAHLTAANSYGDFNGNLSNSGERIALAMPSPVISTDETGAAVTNLAYVVVDEVTYRDGGAWSSWADGGGSSLELIDPRADNRLAANWAASDESGKAPWTVIEASGVLDHGVGTIDQLQLLAQGAGEYLVDDIEVNGETGANLVSNGTLDSGGSGWTFEGTLGTSERLADQGTGDSGCLHVRAVARGDTGANRIRTALLAGLTPGVRATVRARVRWLRGHPEFLLRLRGDYLEAFGPLAVPPNPGTPGAPNSRRTDVHGPAVSNLAHDPVLPAANQAVVVSARVEDPDGIESVTLRYRVDPSTTASWVPMLDDGAGVDRRAGDGVYSARLPGSPAGTLVAFQVIARDGGATTSTTPLAEALVRYGEVQPPGTLGTYRLWMTQATFNEWSSRPKLDNAPLPVTFVYNNERVVHGVGATYAGSPHISPGYSTPSGNLCGYVLSFTEDEPFLGATEVVLDWPGRDATAQQEPMAYWIARELGIPFNHRRFIHLHVNGVTETSRGSVYEDAQQVNSDLVESWNPDSARGDLYKIEQWFEFSDDFGTTQVGPPRLENYTTTGGARKLARYRWSWLKRAVQGSANDYRTLFGLVDVANVTDPDVYSRQVPAFIDIEEWMRVFATENIVVNLDAWGYDIGKNMYAYKPAQSVWQLYMWDIDWVMLASAQHGYSPQSPLMYRGSAVFGEDNRDPAVGRMYDHPTFQRAYWRAIEDAVNGPLDPDRVAARMDATYAALVADGVTRSSGAGLAAPTDVKDWLKKRRDYLVSQLQTVDAPFAVAPTPTSMSGSNWVTVQGTAPIGIREIRVNDRPYLVEWSDVNHWSIGVPLKQGPNSLRISGFDRLGEPVPGASTVVHVAFQDVPDEASHVLAFNEIQYQPAVAGGQFVEIYNHSTDTAFDLSGWRVDGLALNLPSGTMVLPGDYLLLAADRQALSEEHGILPWVAAEFPGHLNPRGETLSLLPPADHPDPDTAIDRVSFEVEPPWPVPAAGSGASIQLRDAAQDNRRPANWAIVEQPVSNAPPQTLVSLPGDWRYNESGADLGTAWTAPDDDDQAWPEGGALFYHESAALPAAKVTPLHLGPTCYYFRTHFEFDGDPQGADLNLTTIIDDGAVFHLNGEEIYRLGMPSGAIRAGTFASRNTPDATQEGPFRVPATALRRGDNVLAVEVHQVNEGSSDITFGLELETVPRVSRLATPGAPNSVRTTLPFLTDLWINELQPDNRAGPRDSAGDADPWVEIFNAGTETDSLGDCYLADPTMAGTHWSFPGGTELGPGAFLVVWLDGEPGEGASELHANFRLDPRSGGLALVKSSEDGDWVLDALHYASLGPDRVVALLPDGNPDQRIILPAASAGRPNALSPSPPQVVINEWMSSNQGAVADPADGDYDDWFELYNPSIDDADLTGCYLSDDAGDARKFPIPTGTIIPPGGFLLVWADEEGGQYAPGGDLHANFRLNQTGETLVLLRADLSVIDELRLPSMPADRSGGRWPDGAVLSPVLLGQPTPGAPNAPPTAPNPTIIGVTMDQTGLITVTWSAESGANYRLQATASLVNGPWTDVTGDVKAPGTAASAAEPGPTRESQRFYRVRRVP